jgi:hypothetical protein
VPGGQDRLGHRLWLTLTTSKKDTLLNTVTAETAIAHLEALSAALLRLGWQSRLSAEAGRLLGLLVRTPASAASAQAETIYCSLRIHSLWFWWSWAEPISLVDDLENAASMIMTALGQS